MKHSAASLLASLLLVVAMSAAELPPALVDAYLQVQRALASDSLEGVAASASAIAAAATALGKDGDPIAVAARKLHTAKDIAGARTAFGVLSEALVGYATTTKSGFGPDARVAFCPMVNKPWLQKEKEIRNPYYGASMISCGTFR